MFIHVASEMLVMVGVQRINIVIMGGEKITVNDVPRRKEHSNLIANSLVNWELVPGSLKSVF